MLYLRTGSDLSLGATPLAPATFRFTCDDSPAVEWRVRAFELQEALSEPYKLQIELLTTPGIETDQLLGARCTLDIRRHADGRCVHGLVTQIHLLGVTAGRLRVHVDVEPALALLSQQTDTRFWQDRTAAQILGDVLRAPLRELGCDLALRLDPADLPLREYCVQYRESDLDFAARLMHEEGLVYYFTHSPDGSAETLVIAESAAGAPELAHALDAVPFVARHTGTANCQTLATFDWRSRLGTTAVTLRDWDWQQAETSPFERVRDGQDVRARTRRRFEHDERRLHRDDGTRRARLLLEERATLAGHGLGESDVVEMLPGHIVALQGLERAELDGDYLLVKVTHRGDAPDEETFSPDSSSVPRYINSFECIRSDTPFRAQATPPRPRVFGPHTAIVVGPPNEEIHTDEHGRIKVRFHWDRRSPPDDTASCWIRVAQLAAGAGWGGLFLPRVGMEVLVEFIDGDPDRPLVTGCVYNSVNRTPHPLPDHKTRSTLKSESTPGGGGHNELRFEDAKGQEELYLHAQRDLREVARHDNTRTVGHDQTLRVEADQSISIVGKQTITVTGDRRFTVEEGNAHTKIAAGSHFTVVERDRSIAVETGDDTLVVKRGFHATTATEEVLITSTDSKVELLSLDTMKLSSGQHDLDLTGHTQAKLVARTDSLTLQGNTDVTLSSSTTRVDISAPNEVRVASPQVIDVSGANLRFTAGEKIVFSVGASSITLEPTGITLSAPKIASAAVGTHEILGAIIKLN